MSRNGWAGAENRRMQSPVRDMPELELALLRRGVDEMAAGCERCERCHRTPLVGERVYVYESGSIACELCRALKRDTPHASRVVHGPEFGHTMRSTDHRAAA
jgi:hypothetical protein